MFQLIEDSLETLSNNTDYIDSVRNFIDDGYSINDDFASGIANDDIDNLQALINNVNLTSNIKVYRGLSDEQMQIYSQAIENDPIRVGNRFTSTTLIYEIAAQHGATEIKCFRNESINESSNVIAILLDECDCNGLQTNAFYVNSLDLIYTKGNRKVGLKFRKQDGYQVGYLTQNCGIPSNRELTDYANGEEEVLLGPGDFISCGFVDQYGCPVFRYVQY
jgi:hypothetical protein